MGHDSRGHDTEGKGNMFEGLTFFGIPLTWFLRLAELLVMAWIGAGLWLYWQWKKAKRDWMEGGG